MQTFDIYPEFKQEQKGRTTEVLLNDLDELSSFGVVIELASHYLQRFGYVVISSAPFPVVPLAVTNVCL